MPAVTMTQIKEWVARCQQMVDDFHKDAPAIGDHLFVMDGHKYVRIVSQRIELARRDSTVMTTAQLTKIMKPLGLAVKAYKFNWLIYSPTADDRHVDQVNAALTAAGYAPVATGDRSSWAFIDKTNGDVLMSAGWKKPAKHARGNITDEHQGMKHMSWSGPAYLK